MKRVMCIWLPRWSLQRLCLVRPELKDRPVVLHGPARRGGREVVLCSKIAGAQGVVPGMPLAEAQALLSGPPPNGASLPHPTANLEPYDLQADREFLSSLAAWCQRYSPLVGLEEAEHPESLLLDITGCAPLFGGESSLVGQVSRDFRQAGFHVRVAIAGTIGAAWALAHFDSRSTKADHEILSALPLDALRLPAKLIETLHELDIRNVGQLRSLPRSSLPARFGPQVLQRLDQMFGAVPELITPVRPAEPIEAEWVFESPTADRLALEAVLRSLLEQVVGQLASREAGVQRLVCRLFCVRGEPLSLTVGAVRPRASVDELLDLVRLQLERTMLEAEVLAIHLEALAIGRLESEQEELFAAPHHRAGGKHLAILIDRLSSRLGREAVLRPRLVADAQPECAAAFEAVLIGSPASLEGGSERKAARPCPVTFAPPSPAPLPRGEKGVSSGVPQEAPRIRRWPRHQDQPDGSREGDSLHQNPPCSSGALRPLVLKRRPQPIAVVSVVPDGPPIRFCWDREEHLVLMSWGPERIETGWWRGPQVRRDYYRVETTAGRRFWLFRVPDEGSWFLHGVFE